MTTDAAIRMNYIFVDYENVQAVDLDLIVGKAVKVFLVVGQRRKTLPSLLARQIHQYHDQVTWIESEGATKNALDLVLAYHVGLQAKADPKGYFHILAGDKDYDALIKHLRVNSILASRDDEFARIPVLVAMTHLSLEDRVKWVVERFQNKVSRPKRKQKLLTTIGSFCRKELSDDEVQQIVTAMVARKLIELTPQGEVAYQL
jgi:hypothetical protein